MWKLDPPTTELIKWHETTLLEGLYKRIKNKNDESGVTLLDEVAQHILIPLNPDGTEDKSILRQLLILPPIELHELCENIMSQLIIDYDENEFESFLKAKAKKVGINQKLQFIINITLFYPNCVKYLIMKVKYLLKNLDHIN